MCVYIYVLYKESRFTTIIFYRKPGHSLKLDNHANIRTFQNFHPYELNIQSQEQEQRVDPVVLQCCPF